jgi:hypothetical protein
MEDPLILHSTLSRAKLLSLRYLGMKLSDLHPKNAKVLHSQWQPHFNPSQIEIPYLLKKPLRHFPSNP